jgi:uncharacterized protein (DUF4415 family)
MKTHKWSELEAKIPPERKAAIQERVKAEIARIEAENQRHAEAAMSNPVTIHIEPEVLQWYKSHSDNFEEQINAALRREMAYA